MIENAFTIKPKSFAAELELGARKSRNTSKAVNERRKNGEDPNRLWGLSPKADAKIKPLSEMHTLATKTKTK